MAVIENRYMRIEDWEGNVYYPTSDSKSSTAGSVIDASTVSSDPTATTYTDGEVVSDKDSSTGKAIYLKSSSARLNVFTTSASGLQFGDIAVMLRLKSSLGYGTTTNLLELNTYFVDTSGTEEVVTKLDTFNITGDNINTANKYVTLGYVTNYAGQATGNAMLRVELILLPDTGASIYFDYLTLSLAMKSTAEGASAYVDGRTVVLG